MNFLMYILLGIQILGMVGGQLLTKEGVNRIGEISLNTLPQAISSPWLWGGALVYVGASVLWMWLLTKGEFTALVPLQSLSMVITVIAGALLFGETIASGRWIGIALMTVGAFLVAR
ncbi:MAG: EamA family transporter [Clostridia bacterium]|nr:EamA family transporter [Clostridia bacterium]